MLTKTSRQIDLVDYRDVRADKAPFLEDLLWEWVVVHERAARAFCSGCKPEDRDCLWWYGERTSVGALAGAIWRCGGIVLEEYSMQKNGKKRKMVNGRGDIWFKLGGKRFHVEAKQCWPRRGKDNWIIDGFERAERDSAKCSASDVDVHLAIVFATLSLPSSHSDDLQSVNAAIDSSIGVYNLIDSFASAWVFPAITRGLKWTYKTTGKSRCYPGTAIFVRKLSGDL